MGLLSFLKESKMASFKFILLSIAIFAFFEHAHADDDPEATKCYAYKTGAFATQGGSTEPGPQEKTSGQKSYCYVAMKKQPGGQGLHAQQAQFEGDCIQKGDRILTHPGIDVDELPSCSNQGLGRTYGSSGSSILGSSVFVFFSSVIMGLQF